MAILNIYGRTADDLNRLVKSSKRLDVILADDLAELSANKKQIKKICVKKTENETETCLIKTTICQCRMVYNPKKMTITADGLQKLHEKYPAIFEEFATMAKPSWRLDKYEIL